MPIKLNRTYTSGELEELGLALSQQGGSFGDCDIYVYGEKRILMERMGDDKYRHFFSFSSPEII